MKFKFCSDGDCPLWALAGLHALSSLPAPLFRTYLQHVVEEQPDDGLMDILKGTSLSSQAECARAAAVIRWVLRQCWRCGCSGSQLSRDLLVLGVPRAHATALAQFADSARDAYVANAEANALMVKKLTDISASSAPEGTVDSVKLTLYSQNTLTGENEKKELLIEKTQAKTLLEQLKMARHKMENINID